VVKAGGGFFIASTEDAEVFEEGKAVNDPLKSNISTFKQLNLCVPKNPYCFRDVLII
jgi:hypothetical protein